MIIYLVLGIALFLVFFFWLSGLFFGAPFQSSSDKAMKTMVRLSGVKKGERVADLGSGTGKLVVEFAKKGAIVTGFEINPLLAWISRRKIKNLGLQKRARIVQANFWKTDLSRFDIITVFQIGYIMKGLERKLGKELTKGAKVVSNTWKFPGKKPAKTQGYVRLYRF